MYLYFFPLMAAALGWVANLILLNYIFRKVIPAKAPAVAAMAGKYASGKILNADHLAAAFADPQQLAAVRPMIENHIDVFLKEKLKEKMPAIAMFIGEKTIDMMKKSLMEEIDHLLPNLLSDYAGRLGDKLDLEQILIRKIGEMPEGRLEALLHKHLKKEKRMFQLAGALSGFVIGLVLLLVALSAR